MKHVLLLVEDNEDDAFFLRRSLKQAGVPDPVCHLTNGRDVLDYFSGTGTFSDRKTHPIPNVVLLDLNLPYLTGLQVLEWVRRRPELAHVVVIVLTSSSEETDVQRAYGLGANSYVVKPSTSEEFGDLADALKKWWLQFNRPATVRLSAAASSTTTRDAMDSPGA